MKITSSGKFHNTSVALGMFDGVHLAHQAVIRDAVEYARENALTSLVHSFSAHPRTILFGETVPVLTEKEEKESLLSSLGVDLFYEEALTEEFLTLSPEEFIKSVLVERFGAKYISVGYNYRFGKGGKGNTDTLIEAGKTYGFRVSVIPPMEMDGEIISSTAIRTFLKEGNIQKANLFLGRPFSLRGKVEHGREVGRTLGFPTINLPLPETFPKMLFGVYATRAEVDGKILGGVTNIGIRPTFHESIPLSETHLIEFEGDLYGKEITLSFLDFLREEIPFSSPEELREQIIKDKKKVVDTMEKL